MVRSMSHRARRAFEATVWFSHTSAVRHFRGRLHLLLPRTRPVFLSYRLS